MKVHVYGISFWRRYLSNIHFDTSKHVLVFWVAFCKNESHAQHNFRSYPVEHVQFYNYESTLWIRIRYQEHVKYNSSDHSKMCNSFVSQFMTWWNDVNYFKKHTQAMTEHIYSHLRTSITSNASICLFRRMCWCIGKTGKFSQLTQKRLAFRIFN